MIKAVFFDVDGTLVSHTDGRVPQSARHALAALRERGILTFVATGRFKTELDETGFLKGIPFDGYIGLNGQYCWDDERVLYTLPIESGDVRTVLNYIERKPFPCTLVGDWGLCVNYVDACVRAAQAGISSEVPPLGDLAALAEQPVYQMIGYVEAPFELGLVSELVHTKVTRWHRYGFDLLPREGGKHNGAGRMLALHGIRPEEALAIGDGDNDVDLFRFVGESAAMGGASISAKQAACYVTAPVEADGIENALKHYGLIP